MKIRYTSQFKKDFKKIEKRGKDAEKLKELIHLLFSGKPLSEKYIDHPLHGNWQDYRDCHVEPDWLLIYKTTPEEIILVCTGSHSDLFK